MAKAVLVLLLKIERWRKVGALAGLEACPRQVDHTHWTRVIRLAGGERQDADTSTARWSVQHGSTATRPGAGVLLRTLADTSSEARRLNASTLDGVPVDGMQKV
jgi:hypothetical protein